MTFSTQFDSHERVFSNVGDEFVITYKSSIDSHGHITLKESGKIDIREKINSYADSCDMSVIVQQFLNGNTSILNQAPTQYMDIVDMPENYFQFRQLQLDAEKDFMSRDPEFRKLFDNSVDQYIMQFGTDEFISKVNEFYKIDPPTPEDPKKEAIPNE